MLYFSPTQNSTNLITSDSVYVNRAALVALVDGGAKNLLKITATSQTINGVTFTVNDDGTITANGTATDYSELHIEHNITLLGEYILTLYASDGEVSCPLRIKTASGTVLVRVVTNESSKFSDISNAICTLTVTPSTTLNNVVFKPMICTAADYAISPAFVPYRPSWDEMWSIIQALQT